MGADDVKIIPPGSYVFFNQSGAINDFPPARDTIMRLYERWLHHAEPHVKTDNQQALEYLFGELTKQLRPIINIPPHLRVIGVKGTGFKAGPIGNHREVWFTIGIPEERQRYVIAQQSQLSNFLQQQDLTRRLQSPGGTDPRFGMSAVADPFKDAVEKRLATAMKAAEKHEEGK